MPTDGKPKNGIVRQLFSYGGVSAMQTCVEFGVFAVLQLAGLPFRLANAVAVFCSGSFNYTMAVKIVTMGMQAVWGFLLCRYVIFK